MSKLLEVVYLTNEVRVRKSDGEYFVETDFGDTTSSDKITLEELSSISRKLTLMTFEHHNPGHYELKPIGFKS